MKIRSTMLGDEVLTGRIEGLKTQGDHIIIAARTTMPVEWQIKVALTHKDLTHILFRIIRSRIPLYVLRGFWNRKRPKLPAGFRSGG